MERLTYKLKKPTQNGFEYVGINGANAQKVLKKLGELENLEEKGRLLCLPCKVGDTVYVVKYLDEGYIVEAKVDSFKTRKDAILAYDKFDKFIGCLVGGLERRAFLTKAEAEKALAEMEK